jgi:hypothetical protein
LGQRTGEPGTGKDDDWGRELVNREPGTGKDEYEYEYEYE